MSAAHVLTLDDILDQRAYERERDAFRAHVIAVKKRRRVSVGPVITLTFENRMTMRFQIQEMARAERMSTDAQIQHELDVYNRLLPARGELSATLFVELTDERELRHWLPRLVGIERACQLRVGEVAGGGARYVIPSVPEQEHQANLTREATTSAVHYVRFVLDDQQVEAFTTGPVRLVVDHPGYPDGRPGVLLADTTRAELAADLVGEA
ncbi:MAG TPA: DUF3501 family protein [Acidimicrobiales bacterium]|nr:DUF3501 family protein [Acidimicrobiales bacterium]